MSYWHRDGTAMVHPLLPDGTAFTTLTLPRMYLILCSIANEALGVSEGHIAGRGAVALVVWNDLHPVILPYTHAAAYGRELILHIIPRACKSDRLESSRRLLRQRKYRVLLIA